MVYVDTNIVLRYVLQDNLELSEKATHIISNNRVICLNSVLYEVIHVMKSVYKIERHAIADELHGLFLDNILASDDTLLTLKALSIFKQTSMDFIDCLLIARHILYQDTIYSFDKKLNNYILRHNSH